MCGRYALDCGAPELERRFEELGFDIQHVRKDAKGFEPSYNIAPTQVAPVLTHHGDLRFMNWGLVPSWVKDVSKAQPYKTFNARKENIATSKMWTAPCNYKRCVVPISGYYEWQTKGKLKIPYYITRKDRELMFLAGMYDHVQKQEFYSYTIITGPAPENLQWLHHRMPVMLERGSKSWNAWLDESKTDWNESELQSILEARCDPDVLEWWQVNSDVGKVTNNGAYLIEPARAAVRNFFKKEDKMVGSLAKLEEHNSEEVKSERNDDDGDAKSLKQEQDEEFNKPDIHEKEEEPEKFFKEQLPKPSNKESSSQKSSKNNRNNKRQSSAPTGSGIEEMLRASSKKRRKL